MTTRSEALYERAKQVLPGGISRNTVYRRPQPYYAVQGAGCYVTDLEGVRRIDFSNNVASLIHGHAHPEINQAIINQLQRGAAFGIATEGEIEFAELMCRRVPGFDKIRFVNSGSEAIMASIKVARAYTGRPKIAKVEGAYHGAYDYAEISQNPQPTNWGDPGQPNSVPLAFGTPASIAADVVVIPFNDLAAATRILNQHRNELAGVLLDLLPHRVGFIPASAEFVGGLRDWTTREGALLIFDEIITFRTFYGGNQEMYAARPDITALGKMIGGGLPVGAFAGREEVMRVLDPSQSPVRMPHSGTFSANALTMAAGRKAMELFDREAVARLNRLGELARERIAEAIRTAGIPACVSGLGSIFRVHLKPQPPRDYRSAHLDPHDSATLAILIDHLFEQGIMLINSCSGTLSTPMGEPEIDRLAEAMLSGFRLIQPRLK